MAFRIPALKGALLDEMGFCLTVVGSKENVGERNVVLTCMVDDLYSSGEPEYELLFEKENEEVWNVFHREISQMTRLKGLLYLESGDLHLSCSDYGEAYTGGYSWKDYSAEFEITPVVGGCHMVNFRVQGGIRSYAVALLENNRIALMKNANEYKILEEHSFDWQMGQSYSICVTVSGAKIDWKIQERAFSYLDKDKPYTYGCVGVSVQEGSHVLCRKIKLMPPNYDL